MEGVKTSRRLPPFCWGRDEFIHKGSLFSKTLNEDRGVHFMRYLDEEEHGFRRQWMFVNKQI